MRVRPLSRGGSLRTQIRHDLRVLLRAVTTVRRTLRVLSPAQGGRIFCPILGAELRSGLHQYPDGCQGARPHCVVQRGSMRIEPGAEDVSITACASAAG